MKTSKIQMLVLGLVLVTSTSAIAQWKPAGDNLKTSWGENINPDKVWQEYPRPIMERSEWQNLNGFWNYAIVPADSVEPTNFDGQILVPFCVESSLSGVQKPLTEKQELWYEREFTVPVAWSGKSVLLNFGAVDWKAEVYVNGSLAGVHTGGYTPFSFDITSLLNSSGSQKLVVKVTDPTETSFQPVGKQSLHPHLIWYTAVSGIWQTVWLEPVGQKRLESLVGVADIDQQTLTVKATANSTTALVEVRLQEGTNVVATGKGVVGRNIVLSVKSPKLWDAQHPFLYGLEAVLSQDGQETDRIKSYVAMRKISTHRDKDGFVRIQLNNHDIFQLGPLDQGYWPDGLYTPPSDEAMRYDLVKTKEWGFNMIRKHMKVEPARWYTACDQLGLLVWQDMPANDTYPKWEPFKYGGGTEVKRSPESAANYRKEWKEIMDALMPYPCIVDWTPFNEAWGQFDTIEIAKWTKKYDPTRLVDPASGGNHRPCGDLLDTHHYPDPETPLQDNERANVLGEFGGILFTLDDHLWKADPKSYWDKHEHTSKDDVTKTYAEYLMKLGKLIPQGLDAAVYTQTTDVEVEVNGLMTYDREVIKFDETAVEQANAKIVHWFGPHN